MPISKITSLGLALCAFALSSCGNSYMLYETRYIPEPGERISDAEFAELPWREPNLHGDRPAFAPSRDAIPRYQTPGKAQVKRGSRNFRYEGNANDGYLGADHIENRGKPIPK